MRGGERGRLTRERIGLPVEHVAEEHRRLVVQVVAGGDDRVAVLDGGPIHEVALAEPAGRAGGPARGLLDLGDGRAHRVGHALHDELLAAGGREALALGLGLDGVVEDAQIEIEPGRLVARLDQHVPQREGILAAGDGDQDQLLAAEHPVLADRLRDLLAEELLEVGRALTLRVARPRCESEDRDERECSSGPEVTRLSLVHRGHPPLFLSHRLDERGPG